jgi:hypothetical protein
MLVQTELVSSGEYAFLEACREGAPLADAAAAALHVEPAMDLQAGLARHLSMGTFGAAR